MTTYETLATQKYPDNFTYPDRGLFCNLQAAAQRKAVAETAEELRAMAFAESARIAEDFAIANENMGGPESTTVAARAIAQLILDKIPA